MNRRRLARWISIAGHPFVLVPTSIAVATTRLDPAARAAILGAAALAMAAVAIFVVRERRRGAVTDLDVTRRDQRPRVFAVAIVATGASLALIVATRQPVPVIFGSALALALVVACAVVNKWIKVSLHCAFAAYAAGIFWTAGWACAIAGAVCAVAVAWARVAYDRHGLREVVGGLALGAAAAVALAGRAAG